MLNYLIRRIAFGVLTLILISFIVYGLIRNMPGTPLTTAMSMVDPSREISAEDVKRLERIFGLDRPWHEAYFVWIGNVVRGDFGRSLTRPNAVVELIRQRVGPTLLLTLSSLSIAWLLSVPMGILATARSGRVDERLVSTLLYMLYALPSFVAALFLQILLAVKLGWLPLLGMTAANYDRLSPIGQAWDIFQHAFMPVLCYTYGSLAFDMRFTKANMEEVVRQDYIRTARAKGVGPVGVFCKHAFRNALVPLVTMIGLTLPVLLSGSILIERIFSWPGMGSLYFESLLERDYPTIMGLTLMFSVLTLIGQLLADVLYAAVDPRVSYS